MTLSLPNFIIVFPIYLNFYTYKEVIWWKPGQFIIDEWINVYEQDVTENVLFVLYQSYKAPINKHQSTYLPGHNVKCVEQTVDDRTNNVFQLSVFIT